MTDQEASTGIRRGWVNYDGIEKYDKVMIDVIMDTNKIQNSACLPVEYNIFMDLKQVFCIIPIIKGTLILISRFFECSQPFLQFW
jgi:hypothetical protein